MRKMLRQRLTVTVLNKEALIAVCADPGSVYEGAEDVAFDCTASGAPAGSNLHIRMDGEGEYIGHIAFERHGCGLTDVPCTG